VGEFEGSPVAAVFTAGYRELARLSAGGAAQDAEANLERALRRAAQVERTQLEQYVAVLATTGSTAPFIGLFGTVWGILQAFLKLGQPGSAATIQVVGPDIAHALVATAVGLVAAIPAVMAYNYFLSSLRILETEMDNFSSDFLNLVKRRSN
jgi:biopolymer transport protein TolQ